MNKSDSVLLKVFTCGLPLIGLLAVYTYGYNAEMVSHAAPVFNLLNSCAGLVFAVWITLSVYLSIRLMVSESFREQVLVRLTFMRERDEREVMLTGKATRTAFLTSLALLVFLFCLSCFHVSVYRVPPEKAVNGKTGMVSLGLGFDLLQHHPAGKDNEAMQKQDIFSYTGLPVSNTSVILLLIVWQVTSFNYVMRRMTR